jgi:hypothetical protein
MGAYPFFLFLAQKRFNITVTAVRKSCHKDKGIHYFACIAVHNTRRLSCPVYLHEFARLAVYVHRGFRFGNILAVMGFKLRQLIWNLS